MSAAATTLAAIGLKAIEHHKAVVARKSAQHEFGEACAKWKTDNGFVYVERHTEDFERMVAAADAEYQGLTKARSIEHNAMARLRRACCKESVL